MAGGMTQGEGRPAVSTADSLTQHAAAQQGEQARDQQIGKRVLLGQRLWFLVVVPLALLAILFAHIRPAWPYAAVVWATGPIAALLALRICRRPSRQAHGRMPTPWNPRLRMQTPMVTYTSQTIADLTILMSMILLVASIVYIAIDSGSPAGSAHALQVVKSWHALFGVLPALLLAIAVRVIVHQLRRRGEGAAGAE
jgi:hypothetical protein